MGDLQDIINEARSGIDYGTLHLTLKIFDKNVATIDTDKFVSYMVERGNAEALTIIGTVIKNTSIALKTNPEGIPPTLTFSVYYGKTGEVERLQMQDFKRFNNK